jgi:hypothetical protein
MKHTATLDTRQVAAALGAEHEGVVAATDPHWTERRSVTLTPETLARLGAIAKKPHDTKIVALDPTVALT